MLQHSARASDGSVRKKQPHSPAKDLPSGLHLLRFRAMVKYVCGILCAALTLSASAAELALDFSQYSVGSFPTGFVSKVSGAGNPGEWAIIEDEIPVALEPLSPNAPKTRNRIVLAQRARESTDEHFPLLIYPGEIFGDFILKTRFKCVEGSVERMAGIAFRVQDEKNYYVVRASALGNSFRFYKVVNGDRSQPIGPSAQVPSGVWQEMSVECKGNQIRCLLNGKELIPVLTDNSFTSGKIAFWTKSDSVSYFADTLITYSPRVPLAQTIIADMMQKYPRLIGLKFFSTNAVHELRVIASSEEGQLGEQGEKAEENVFANGIPYYAKANESVSVIMPVRDRNGDTVATLRIIMKPFPGQTQSNVLARALPILKAVEARIVSLKDLTQ
ncbi:MAG: family 16 glycoside hydrolase [Verrucomicrobiota bacterium]